MSKNHFKPKNQTTEPVKSDLVEDKEETGEDVVVESTEEPVIEASQEQPDTPPVVTPKETPPKQQSKPAESRTPMNHLIVFLTQYHEKLLSLKNDDEVGKLQLSLYRKVIEVLSKPDFEEVRTDLNTILKYIHTNRDKGLDEVNMFRGAAQWTGSPQDYASFRRLVWVFLETANPQTRKTSVANVDLTSLEKTLSSTQYNNLISFYS